MELAIGPLKVEDHLNLDAPTPINMTYSDLASEIIHCDGFVWDVFPPYNLFVFSHRNALNRLIVVHLPDYLNVIRDVLADQPKRWFVRKDAATGKITKHATDETDQDFKTLTMNELFRKMTSSDG